MTKRIIFSTSDERMAKLTEGPIPAKKTVPDFFVNTKRNNSNTKSTNNDLDVLRAMGTNDPSHGTYKACLPFTDSLVSGYTITLPCSIYLKPVPNNEGIKTHIWNPLEWNGIFDEVPTLTHPHLPVPYGFENRVLRWTPKWKIQTPLGYSTLFFHPNYREDLPFKTLTGFVDTDKHTNEMLFPFYIRENTEAVLPAGTPIVQFIMVKRDSWESSKTEHDDEHLGLARMKRFMFGGYQKMFWSPKKYS
jgi:hypothetical protein